MSDATMESVLRRDRTIVIAALLVLTQLAWAYVIWLAYDIDMGGMEMSGYRIVPDGMGMMQPSTAPWSAVEFGFVLAMWAVMMVGMMTPSAAPMILLYARIGRMFALGSGPHVATAWFASGYLLVWIGFALIATVAQWALDRASLLTPTMAFASNVVGGAVLIAAGLYQWTPMKDACLRHCRAPLSFLQRHGGFRNSPLAALTLGAHHGAFCLGCCWMLMTLLFVGGVMNVLWIAALAIFVLAEKVIPGGHILSRLAGAGFVAAGVWLIVQAPV